MSREVGSCLSIRRHKFKGNTRAMGWKRQEAGGDLVGTGLLLSPAVLSMCPLTKGQPQVRRPPRRKERGGSNEGSREEEWNLCMRVCMGLFGDSTQCHPLPSPVLTHRDSRTRRPFGLWYIYMLGALSAQRGRLVRRTWANINILHTELLMCGGQIPGSAQLSRLSSERKRRRVGRGVGSYWRADRSDWQSGMKLCDTFWGQEICIHIMRIIYLEVWTRKNKHMRWPI